VLKYTRWPVSESWHQLVLVEPPSAISIIEVGEKLRLLRRENTPRWLSPHYKEGSVDFQSASKGRATRGLKVRATYRAAAFCTAAGAAVLCWVEGSRSIQPSSLTTMARHG